MGGKAGKKADSHVGEEGNCNRCKVSRPHLTLCGYLPSPHQYGPTQGDGGRLLHHESFLPARPDRPGEARLRHVEFRLDKEKTAVCLEKGKNLAKETGFVRYFVGHPEGKNEIGRPLDPQALFPAAVKDDPVGHPRLEGPPSQGIQHLLLEIDGDDLPFRTSQLRQADGKVPHSAAYINGSHAGLHKGGKETFRVMKKAAHGIVEAVA
jgi:hypothetical protein